MKVRRSLALALVLSLIAPLAVTAQPAIHHVGPSYLYPDPTQTPGAVNPDIIQTNIRETICNPQWVHEVDSAARLLHNHSKAQRLAASRFKDKNPSHYEEDHFISLGGNPRDPKNLWPEMWGTPGTPLTSRGPFPPHFVGAKAKDAMVGVQQNPRQRRRLS